MANVILRLPDSLHQIARVAAAAKGWSLNAWVVAAIHAAILRTAARDKTGPVAAVLDQRQAEHQPPRR